MMAKSTTAARPKDNRRKAPKQATARLPNVLPRDLLRLAADAYVSIDTAERWARGEEILVGTHERLTASASKLRLS
jgi:hypothetical protein